MEYIYTRHIANDIDIYTRHITNNIDIYTRYITNDIDICVCVGVLPVFCFVVKHSHAGSFSFVSIRIAVGDPVIKRGEGWDPINRFNPAILLWKAKARTWISNVICRGIFVFREFNLAVC